MSGGTPIETVETNPTPAVFHGGSIFLAGFLAVFAGIGGTAVAGPLLGLPAAVVTFVLLELLFYVGNRRGTVAFYDDHVEFDGDRLAYADVSAAVHSQSFAHGLFDTADFELLAHGADNVTLRYVADPEMVDSVLTDRLPAPERQVDEADAVHDEDRRQKPRYLRNRWAFWHYWDAEAGTVPDDPVVDADELGDVMDVSVSSADLDEIDDVDMDAAAGLGDIDAGDVGADSGGAGGDGFDGGGGAE